MVFSTPVFLFAFLPAVLALYYLVPRRLRNLILLLSSLFFYFWGERSYCILMAVSILVNYVFGLLIGWQKQNGRQSGAKVFLTLSVLVNLGMLVFFKYWDFLTASLQAVGIRFLPVLGIHLPIGISFYTFQTMSYTIDVYRADVPAQKNPIRFGAYVAMFPQLIAGPIVRYKDIATQLGRDGRSWERFASGVFRFTVGLSKKLLLANGLGRLWAGFRDLPAGELTVAGAWLGVLAFSMQIYFDFSGYSDMAIGLGRMFGYEFLENFRYPYAADSISDFWRRWHISLTNWFRDYLYIPLGGNRCAMPRQILNILIVWMATGMWHGASWNYLAWGMYFFVLLLLEKFLLRRPLEKLPKGFRHLYTVVLLVIGWTIFGIEDFGHLGQYLGVMFGFGASGFADGAFLYALRGGIGRILIGAIAALPLGKQLHDRLSPRVRQPADAVLLALGLLACTAAMISGTYNPFLYFRF